MQLDIILTDTVVYFVRDLINNNDGIVLWVLSMWPPLF